MVGKPTAWRTAFVVLLICLWEGFPFRPLGMPEVFGCQIYAGIVLLGLLPYGIRAIRGTVRMQWWEFASLALFLWCIFASYCYSTLINPIPLMDWLPAIFVFCPIITLFTLKALDVTVRDIENGFLIAGTAASSLAILDTVTGLGFLEIYSRASYFSEGRIVFFKLPTAFAVLIAAARAIYAPTRKARVYLALAAVICGANAIFLSESRLVLAAIALGSVGVALFVVRGNRRLALLAIAPLVAIPIGVATVDMILSRATSLDEYLAEDFSTQFRALESAHFKALFETTSGVGFGVMSLDEDKNNVLSYAAYQAGLPHGSRIGFIVLDIGLISALYQFGYPGLFGVVMLTLVTGFTLISLRRIGSDYAGSAAAGFSMLAFMISPISSNFFTMQYGAQIGALLFAMAAAGSSERSQLLRRRATRPARSAIPDMPAGR